MGWWIALGVIFLLGILPLGISARYSGEGPLLRVVIGPVRLTRSITEGLGRQWAI